MVAAGFSLRFGALSGFLRRLKPAFFIALLDVLRRLKPAATHDMKMI